jgi:glutathione peroxidase-family protein
MAPIHFTSFSGEAKGIIGTGAIEWNFTKFLVDRNRGVVSRFAPAAPKELEKEIKNCFNSRAAGCVAARGIRTTNKSSIV